MASSYCNVVWIFLPVVSLLLLFELNPILSRYIPRDNITRIAGIVELASGEPCRNADGDVIHDWDEWRTPGECDRNFCREGFLANFTLTYGCRSIIEEVEAPDPDLCRLESNNTYTFPLCCPVLVCDVRAPFTWAPEPVCYDKSYEGCDWWAGEGGCDINSNYYNFTRDYCQLTCGFCSITTVSP